ncbi:HD domain-containing protein [Pectinatus haikarae]
MNKINELEQYCLKKEEWMNGYIKSFYSKDKNVQEGILIKEEHTRKVTAIAYSLAVHLQMNEHDALLARIIGLFHDIGRFKQFSIYKTFNDAQSENHALLGLKILKEQRLLGELTETDQTLIEFAVKNHNAKQVEPTEDRRYLFFARLIRDADKLDIFRVLQPYLTTDDVEPCSKTFIGQFKNGGQCDYNMIRTQNDRKLVRLLWIYDVNFSWTLDKIVSQGYVAEIVKSLPQTEDMKKGFALLKKYIMHKLQYEDKPFCYRDEKTQ